VTIYNSIGLLPKETIEHIVSFLNPDIILLATLRQVCKKFFNLLIPLNLKINNVCDFEKFMIKADMMGFDGKLTITISHAAEVFHIDFLRADYETSKAVSDIHTGEIILNAEKCTKLKDW
jgi:hypothetical protein